MLKKDPLFPIGTWLGDPLHSWYFLLNGSVCISIKGTQIIKARHNHTAIRYTINWDD